MLSNSQNTFLREKINELGSALFFNESNALLRFPSTVISALEVDKVGQIWFFMSRPAQQIQEFDKEFPVRMNFFRKGKKFYLNLKGKACIVTDPEEINEIVSLEKDIKCNLSDKLVLVKVKIIDFNYHDTHPSAPDKWIEGVKSQLSSWVSGTRKKHYHYQYA